jgi:large subunit ribosomal protein L27
VAHKKGQGSSRNGRDSQGQRRGVKRYAGEQVNAGPHVGMGRDFTLFALKTGKVRYYRSGPKSLVSILPSA